MTGDIEAAADIATGTLVGRAFEPRAGDGHRADHRDHCATGEDALCLNCGTRLLGEHCHNCGQAAHVHRSLGGIGHEIAHGVFHFEGKIWRTLPLLILHPGTLTRRYVNGERARFVSPLALFLFTVFLMVAVVSGVGTGSIGRSVRDGWNVTQAQAAAQQRKEEAEVARLQVRRAAAIASRQPTAALDRQIASRRDDIEALSHTQMRENGRRTGARLRSSLPWLQHGVEEARENPGLVIYKMQSAAYKYSWALIFLSTPLLALLFVWRRGYGLYDHATFVTYSISFMTMLVIVLDLLLLLPWLDWLVVTLAVAVPPAHMFAQLRGAYRLGWFSAAWRTVALVFAALLSLVLFTFSVILLELT